MKKTLFLTFLLAVLCVGMAEAKKKPQIKYEQTTIDLGTFAENDGPQTVVFKFHNVGNAKLVINYVTTSCGCTVADYPKDFISPGGSGEIKVTYDGYGKMPGKFRKTINVFTNGGKQMSRVFIEGNMTAVRQKN